MAETQEFSQNQIFIWFAKQIKTVANEIRAGHEISFPVYAKTTITVEQLNTFFNSKKFYEFRRKLKRKGIQLNFGEYSIHVVGGCHPLPIECCCTHDKLNLWRCDVIRKLVG